MGKKIIILASILLLMSCSKDNDNCECDVIQYEKTITLEDGAFTDIPEWSIDTVKFSQSPEYAFYSNDCEDQNTITTKNTLESVVGSDKIVNYYYHIVKCK